MLKQSNVPQVKLLKDYVLIGQSTAVLIVLLFFIFQSMDVKIITFTTTHYSTNIMSLNFSFLLL